MHRLLLLAILAGSAAAQSPRPAVQLSPGPSFAIEPSVATDGDLAAVLWHDGITRQMLVSVSDGRGLAWSAPKRVDQDPIGGSKAPEVWSTHVVGARIYVAWRDERFGNSNDEIFFNRSLDGGQSWGAEVRIDKGFPPGVGGVRDWRMAVSPGGAGTPDRVFFVMAVDPTVAADEALYFVASNDGGATFGVAKTPSSLPLGAADVDDVALATGPGAVYVAWRDDRFGNDEVFFQKSTNGGTTWLASDLVLSDPLDAWDGDDEVEIAVSGDTIAVAMEEDEPCCSFEVLRVTVSLDGGASWGPLVKVGGYASGVADVDMRPGALAVTAGGNVVVAWSDDRNGAPDVNEVFVATSVDGGATWSADVKLSLGTGGAPKIAVGGERVALTWSNGTTIDDAGAAFSPDGGVSWNPTFLLPKPAGEDVDDPHVAYNALYGNFICVQLAGNLFNEVYAGGFRPQTLHPQGWTSGPTVVSFAFADFQPTTPLAWALFALSPGTLPLPGDGRNLGLAPDAILSTSLNLALAGVFAAPLAVDGSGATLALPVALPPGVTLSAVGLGIDLATVSFGDVTDLVVIQL